MPLWYLHQEIDYLKKEPHLFIVAVRIWVFKFFANKPTLFKLKNIIKFSFYPSNNYETDIEEFSSRKNYRNVI